MHERGESGCGRGNQSHIKKASINLRGTGCLVEPLSCRSGSGCGRRSRAQQEGSRFGTPDEKKSTEGEESAGRSDAIRAHAHAIRASILGAETAQRCVSAALTAFSKLGRAKTRLTARPATQRVEPTAEENKDALDMLRREGAVRDVKEKFTHDSQALSAFNAGFQDPTPHTAENGELSLIPGDIKA